MGLESGADTLVAIAAVVLLISTGCLRFSEFVAGTHWGVLILFGGGLTLSSVLQDSGASTWLAEQITDLLPADRPFLILLIIALFTVFLSELVSNTASAALLVPLFLTVAIGLGLPEHVMAVMIALCASCACMLPVATPPNALAYSSGYVPQRQMMRVGIVMNVTFAATLSLMFYLLAR
ncbi:MAG: SLC13 family permease [Gammaproteobacteria bacterium]|nr:SLC13 family permease [Gammaproteobacteria bacterium]